MQMKEAVVSIIILLALGHQSLATIDVANKKLQTCVKVLNWKYNSYSKNKNVNFSPIKYFDSMQTTYTFLLVVAANFMIKGMTKSVWTDFAILKRFLKQM